MTPTLDVDRFFDEWAHRHFTTSVKLHDAERVTEGGAEARGVLDDAIDVQGVLLELHELATNDVRVRDWMHRLQLLQNGVAALYRWLDDVLGAASAHLAVRRRRPSFVHQGEASSLAAIVGSLKRLRQDLQASCT